MTERKRKPIRRLADEIFQDPKPEELDFLKGLLPNEEQEELISWLPLYDKISRNPIFRTLYERNFGAMVPVPPEGQGKEQIMVPDDKDFISQIPGSIFEDTTGLLKMFVKAEKKVYEGANHGVSHVEVEVGEFLLQRPAKDDPRWIQNRINLYKSRR